MPDGRLVEARVHYRCGCVSHHPRIYERHLAMYVQSCRDHGDRTFDGPGRRVRVEKIRFISPEEEAAMIRAEMFAQKSVYDAQMEDQDVIREF